LLLRGALIQIKDSTAPITAMADVCFGSKADIPLSRRDVRFTPESGHQAH
jgi:hypothetical protein